MRVPFVLSVQQTPLYPATKHFGRWRRILLRGRDVLKVLEKQRARSHESIHNVFGDISPGDLVTACELD